MSEHPREDAGGRPDIELRHLRYFVALSDAGSFTGAARCMAVSQPALSQQIRRLEDLVGTPLLRRRREGLSLTEAGAVLLEESRTVLAQMRHGVDRTRRAAGLVPARLRVLIPPEVPATLAGQVAARLTPAAARAGLDVVWIGGAVDTEFAPVRRREADVALGWLPGQPTEPLDGMSLGEFEPEVWLPAGHPAARRGWVGMDELARMAVVFGSREAGSGVHALWRRVLRGHRPGFEFVDPPVPHSLPMMLALTASMEGTSAPCHAALTAPRHRVGATPEQRAAAQSTESGARAGARAGDGTEAGAGAGAGRTVETLMPVRCALKCTAGLVWHGGLPRDTQQLLFETADGIPW